MNLVAFLLGCVLLAATAAEAVTITIMDGTVHVSNLVRDPQYNFRGENFAARGTSVGNPPDPTGQAMAFRSDLSSVTIGGQEVCATLGFDQFCGGLFFDNTPFLPGPVSFATFVAHGHLDVAGGVDLAGQGVVRQTLIRTTTLSEDLYDYTFTVPEPSSAALLLTCGGVMVLVRSLRRVRQTRVRRRSLAASRSS